MSGDAALQLEAIDSPCVSICRLDDSGMCVGCFRTADEIVGWLGYSVRQRREIMSRLPQRATQLFADDG